MTFFDFMAWAMMVVMLFFSALGAVFLVMTNSAIALARKKSAYASVAKLEQAAGNVMFRVFCFLFGALICGAWLVLG
jgi:hypothetical protein